MSPGDVTDSMVTRVNNTIPSQVVRVVNLPANTGDIRDTGSIPESGRSPEGGNGNPLCILAWRIHRQWSLVDYNPLGSEE